MFFPPFFNSFCELIFPFIFLFPRFLDGLAAAASKAEKVRAENTRFAHFLFGDFILICARTFLPLSLSMDVRMSHKRSHFTARCLNVQLFIPSISFRQKSVSQDRLESAYIRWREAQCNVCLGEIQSKGERRKCSKSLNGYTNTLYTHCAALRHREMASQKRTGGEGRKKSRIPEIIISRIFQLKQ